ncbi:phosphate-transporting ATPase [Luteibacter jiangsuensis]|uniref:Phosphate-transporting ATPase n=1 Tax=Luteibacter jiangsuensis TaxID=637577 RepID=A0ABT9T2N3_9GAMM|nr:ABC transporter ATP-binding protein [Luteibacter jiangsuensis]MDQ0010452.1 phosphate-transporting ATPase [Luteibacter jiangsuensis]
MMLQSQLLSVQELNGFGVGPVSITLAAGERLAVMGASGAGKSLLLRLLADLDPGEGKVTLAGEPRDAIAAACWRRRVMLVPAQAGWWASTVSGHFELSMMDTAVATAARLLLPPDIMKREIRVLSTGERQRLALVRALARQPEVLLLDEPTSGLDPAATEAVEALLVEWSRERKAIVMVTHDAMQAQRMAHRTFTMNRGRLMPA